MLAAFFGLPVLVFCYLLQQEEGSSYLKTFKKLKKSENLEALFLKTFDQVAFFLLF